MKTRTIVFETKFNVEDKVLCITDGKICQGTVEEVFAKVDRWRIDSVYFYREEPEIQVIYKVKIGLGEFATNEYLPESSLAYSLDEFPIHGN